MGKKLHITLNKASANQEQVLAGMKKKLAYTQAASAGELRATKAMFKSRVNTLVNAITANAAKAQRGIRHLTKVARNWKHADAADRKLIRVQRSAMKNDLDKALARAIQLGEARAKAVEERANENIAVVKKSLLPDRCPGREHGRQRVQVGPGQPPKDRRQLPVPQGLCCHYCGQDHRLPLKGQGPQPHVCWRPPPDCRCALHCEGQACRRRGLRLA